MKKERITLVLSAALFLFSMTGIALQQGVFSGPITGFVTTGTTVSNVTIEQYLSISMSENLSSGVLFGSVDTLPATNINATHNYDEVPSKTTMFINVSTDSNTAVDFCIKGNANLYDSVGGNTLNVGNESFSNSSVTDSSLPAVAAEIPLTTSYVWSGNASQGLADYYRFWLDVPVGTASGTYNNTLTFKGVVANGGVGC